MRSKTHISLQVSAKHVCLCYKPAVRHVTHRPIRITIHYILGDTNTVWWWYGAAQRPYQQAIGSRSTLRRQPLWRQKHSTLPADAVVVEARIRVKPAEFRGGVCPNAAAASAWMSAGLPIDSRGDCFESDAMCTRVMHCSRAHCMRTQTSRGGQWLPVQSRAPLFSTNCSDLPYSSEGPPFGQGDAARRCQLCWSTYPKFAFLV